MEEVSGTHPKNDDDSSSRPPRYEEEVPSWHPPPLPVPPLPLPHRNDVGSNRGRATSAFTVVVVSPDNDEEHEHEQQHPRWHSSLTSSPAATSLLSSGEASTQERPSSSESTMSSESAAMSVSSSAAAAAPPLRPPRSADDVDPSSRHKPSKRGAGAAGEGGGGGGAAVRKRKPKRQPTTLAVPVPTTAPTAAATTTTPAHQHSLSHAYQTYLHHDVQERTHFEDVCHSYRQYATYAMAQWANHQYRLHALSDDQRKFLPPALQVNTAEHHERAQLYKDAAIRNQFLLDCILRHAGQPHSQQQQQPPLRRASAGAAEGKHESDDMGDATSPSSSQPSDSQMAKVSSVLKSLVRDWSKEGQVERDQAYRPLLDLVQQYVPLPQMSKLTPPPSPQSRPPRLCVPGAGVGRLALELAARGYEVQGNEFSLHMLLASDFILNGGIATPDHPMRISPYLLETRNVHAASDTTRAIVIPDVDPYSLLMREESHQGACSSSPLSPPQQPDFSMAAGEFVSVYSAPREKGRWNGVVACFFLDNAPCVVEYLQVAYDMLVPGGVLLHFGPLLWHWSGPAFRPDDSSFDDYKERYHHLDPKYMSSVDLSWEDIQAVLVNIGFELVESTTGQKANYTADARSMMCVEYRCLQFVARKPAKNDLGEVDFDL